MMATTTSDEILVLQATLDAEWQAAVDAKDFLTAYGHLAKAQDALNRFENLLFHKACEPEGSDNTVAGQLAEAGYGGGGMF